MTRTIQRLALAGAATLAFALPVSAQMSEDELAAEFALLAEDEAALGGIITAWFGDVPAEHEALYIDYLAGVVGQPGLAAYLVDLAPPDAGENAADYYSRIGYSLADQIIVSGIGRLSTEQQLAYLGLSTDVFDWLLETRPDDCALLLGDDVEALVDIDAAYQASLSTAELQQILDINLAAVAAEITDSQPANTFTAEQTAAAEAALTAAFEARLAADDDPNMLVAAAMGAAEDPTAYCDLGKLTLEVVYDLEGAEQAYALQLMLGGGL